MVKMVSWCHCSNWVVLEEPLLLRIWMAWFGDADGDSRDELDIIGAGQRLALRRSRLAAQVSRRAASTAVRMSLSMKAIPPGSATAGRTVPGPRAAAIRRRAATPTAIAATRPRRLDVLRRPARRGHLRGPGEPLLEPLLPDDAPAAPWRSASTTSAVCEAEILRLNFFWPIERLGVPVAR